MEVEVPTHAAERLVLRGITLDEALECLETGWPASDAAPGTHGNVMVFPFAAERLGRWYEEKEVTVYWKVESGRAILLTAKARFGAGFPRLK